MSLAYGDTLDSLKNREIFLSGLGIDYRQLVCARQVHGVGVRYAGESDKGKGALSYATALADTDALVTDKKNLALAVFTADCLSVFLYDPRRLAVGIVHAGWQSTKGNIVREAIRVMQDKFDTRSRDLLAGFGPAIRECCYEVGAEFRGYFPGGIIERKGRNYLDLAGVNKGELLDAGVAGKNISDCKICTSCRNDKYFSYRIEAGKAGRMMSVIMLR
jgi:hypothetical protein